MLLLLLLFSSPDWPAWNQIALRYTEYIGYFLIYGALGFQWLVHRSRLSTSASFNNGLIGRVYETALYRAARMGLLGAIVLTTELVITGAQKISVKKASFFAAAGPKILIQLAFALLALFAFVAAARGVSRAWSVGWVAGAGFVLRNFAAHKWTGPMNPLHEAGAALWLGTLLTIVVVGLPAALYSGLGHQQRSEMIAHLIRRFSLIALTGASLMVASGIIISWTHLNRWADLWTTSYGVTLCIKLGIVLVVVALGAWNWRRIAPSLETESSAARLRRTSTFELFFAGLVLLATAMLVLLPSPPAPKG